MPESTELSRIAVLPSMFLVRCFRDRDRGRDRDRDRDGDRDLRRLCLDRDGDRDCRRLCLDRDGDRDGETDRERGRG